ncbi:MAG TPA: phosphatase PAP2 family protein [Clostridia bacterium]|nr:phosphatase PAP2 family protein [Clostridia bacterium]
MKIIRAFKPLIAVAKNGEIALFFWMHVALARRWLDYTMKVLTNLGGVYVTAGACATTWVWPGVPRSLPLSMTAAIVGSHLTVQVLKRLVRRTRPYFLLKNYRPIVRPLFDNSFPSGHTTAAFAMAGVISAFEPFFGIIAWPVASLVGISRLYLGHHYPLDVLAGTLAGWLSAFISVRVFGV